MTVTSQFQEATQAYICQIFKNLDVKNLYTTGSIIKAQDIKDATREGNDDML